MKLTDIAKEVRRDPRAKELFISQRQVDLVIRLFVEKVKVALLNEGEAKIHELFTLQFKKNKGRRIKSFNNKEIQTDDFTRIIVRPSRELKKIMKDYK